MNINLSLKYLLSILTLSGTFVFTGNPVTAQTRLKTTFHCIRTQNNVFYTVARRGKRQTAPILKWQNKSWGSQYTPKKRCDIVSDRLTRAVEKNGGQLKGLLMWYGSLNGYPILCYLRSQRERCNSGNILLTLRKSEFGQERKIIKDILTFSVGASGNTTTRTVGKTTPEEVNSVVKFGEQVDSALEENPDSEETIPAIPPVPNATPSNPTPEVPSPSQPVEEDTGF